MAISATLLALLGRRSCEPDDHNPGKPRQYGTAPFWQHRSGMRTDRIEFISEYCDRWCERCAFTSRCSAYAVQAALGMCGDLGEAIQLAVGAPMAPGASTQLVPKVVAVRPTPQEVRELQAEAAAHARRIKESPLTKHAMAVAIAEHRWLHAHAAMRESDDAVVREAVAIVSWDSTFIGGKLARALHGRESSDHDDDPIQNDWNGSAKIALISLERSESAWQTIAHATGDAAAADLASAMGRFRADVEEAFPFARLFQRPGFDECER